MGSCNVSYKQEFTDGVWREDLTTGVQLLNLSPAMDFPSSILRAGPSAGNTGSGAAVFEAPGVSLRHCLQGAAVGEKLKNDCWSPSRGTGLWNSCWMKSRKQWKSQLLTEAEFFMGNVGQLTLSFKIAPQKPMSKTNEASSIFVYGQWQPPSQFVINREAASHGLF